MTEEELDILASSYLDGEATSEEVALVERDPVLMARVRELRTAQNALQTPGRPPAAALKEQHLSTALAAFGGDDRRAPLFPVDARRSETSDPSIDLTNGDLVPLVPVGAGPAERDDDSVIDLRSRRVDNQPNNRMRWLSAAAGFLIFGFGAVFLANQMNSAGETAEVAVAADASDEAADEAADAPVEESAEDDAEFDDSATAGNAVATESQSGDSALADGDAGTLESEEMSADAEEALTVTDDPAAADDAAAETSDESAVNQGADAPGPPIIREGLPESGFFPDEPVVSYSNVPTSDEIVGNLDLAWRDPEFARCSAEALLAADAELIAFLPIEVTQPDGNSADVEALYIVTGPDWEVILVNPDTCELF